MMKIHHVGYLVKKIERALAMFEGLGFSQEGPLIRDESRLIDIIFLQKDGYRIELVSPYDAQSIVGGLVSRCGNAPYHICYETDDFDEEIARLREARYVISSVASPAPAFEGRRVVFMINPYLGIIELVDTKTH